MIKIILVTLLLISSQSFAEQSCMKLFIQPDSIHQYTEAEINRVLIEILNLKRDSLSTDKALSGLANRLYYKKRNEILKFMTEEQLQKRLIDIANRTNEGTAQEKASAEAIVKLNREKGADLLMEMELGVSIHGKTVAGETALHMAVQKNRLDFAKILLDRGLDINAQDNNGYTPLFTTTKSTPTELIKFLWENGSNPFITTKSGNTFFDLVIKGAQKGMDYYEIAEKLMYPSFIEYLVYLGVDIYMNRNLSSVKKFHLIESFLLDYYASLKPEKIREYFYKIDNEVFITKHDLKSKLEGHKITPSEMTDLVYFASNTRELIGNKNTLMEYAILSDNVRIAKILIKSGLDLTYTDKDDRTFVYMAAFSNNYAILKILVESGAPVDSRYFSSVMEKGIRDYISNAINKDKYNKHSKNSLLRAYYGTKIKLYELKQAKEVRSE